MTDARPGSRDHLPHGPMQTASSMGSVTQAKPPLPVLATIFWLDGFSLDVPAIAVAWTNKAVEVVWEVPEGGMSRDWLPAKDIRRGRSAAARINPAASTTSDAGR